MGPCLRSCIFGWGRSTGDYTEQGYYCEDFSVVQFSATSLAIILILSYQMVYIQVKLNMDGFVKSPHAALRFKTRHCDVPKSTNSRCFWHEPVLYCPHFRFLTSLSHIVPSIHDESGKWHGRLFTGLNNMLQPGGCPMVCNHFF